MCGLGMEQPSGLATSLKGLVGVDAPPNAGHSGGVLLDSKVGGGVGWGWGGVGDCVVFGGGTGWLQRGARERAAGRQGGGRGVGRGWGGWMIVCWVGEQVGCRIGQGGVLLDVKVGAERYVYVCKRWDVAWCGACLGNAVGGCVGEGGVLLDSKAGCSTVRSRVRGCLYCDGATRWWMVWAMGPFCWTAGLRGATGVRGAVGHGNRAQTPLLLPHPLIPPCRPQRHITTGCQ